MHQRLRTSAAPDAATRRLAPCVWMLLLAACVGACTTPPSADPRGRITSIPNGVTANPDAERRWYTTCFRMPFDADGKPEWALDLLLADRVAAPALATHAADIGLWRFHRRAAPDAAGHQFSLLVYASALTASSLRERFDADPTLRDLLASGLVTSLVHDCRAAQGTPDVEATSDPAWDPSIQRAWPWFIMGVSASWLALIQDLARDRPPASADPLPAYREIDGRIEQLWAAQGQHAFLHHLSGLYGYRPLRIETWMRY